MIELIPYIVAIMIFYDLSIHLVYLLKKEDFFKNKKISWWPYWDRWGKKEKRKYQIFWSVFWGIAFVLMLLYLVSN